MRIVYTKLRNRFQHFRICGRFFSLLMSSAASQAKLQFLQLYCVSTCQVNGTAGSDGWLHQCAGGSRKFCVIQKKGIKREKLKSRARRWTLPSPGAPTSHVKQEFSISPHLWADLRTWRATVQQDTSRDGLWLQLPWKSQQDLINWARRVKVCVSPVLTLLLYFISYIHLSAGNLSCYSTKEISICFVICMAYSTTILPQAMT